MSSTSIAEQHSHYSRDNMPNFNDEIRTDNDYTEFYRFFPDDVKFFANLIKENWQLEGPAEIDSHPIIYYDSGITSTRENTLGGSIYVYDTGTTYPQIMGMDYDAVKQTRGISIDIQNPDYRERNLMWTREVERILRHFRRAGRNRLNGWDYLEIQNVNNFDKNYVRFYQSVVNIKLYRTLNDMEDRGRGD